MLLWPASVPIYEPFCSQSGDFLITFWNFKPGNIAFRSPAARFSD